MTSNVFKACNKNEKKKFLFLFSYSKIFLFIYFCRQHFLFNSMRNRLYYSLTHHLCIRDVKCLVAEHFSEMKFFTQHSSALNDVTKLMNVKISLLIVHLSYNINHWISVTCGRYSFWYLPATTDWTFTSLEKSISGFFMSVQKNWFISTNFS